MIAFDASLLFGAVETRDRRYQQTERTLRGFTGPCCTTEGCLTEAMYLAGSRIGWSGQERIWQTMKTWRIELLPVDLTLVERLMRRYKDVPMDFADATLVALASQEPRARVATFDSDFLAYRRDDGSPMPLVEDRLLGWA